jgi:mitochondrial fission protein ELM1
MGLLELRSSIKILNPRDSRRAYCVRPQPERICLAVASGATPNGKPPVRIFLGTEPGQYQAERIFVYSIERNRNPARAYEIYLMNDLVGFDRRGWTTGFTNYRFAVPELAGGRGRAIFNDVDEAYFGDPADLFDADMGNHGYLATSDVETSVMLIDCDRMAPIWTRRPVRHELKKDILRRTLRDHPGIRGDLPREWTARDADFEVGFSKLQHWTTLQTQPWRPVPGRFVYQPNPTGQLWFDLKRAADEEGYQVFDATRPSSLYTGLIEQIGESLVDVNGVRPTLAAEFSQRLEKNREKSGAQTLLDVGFGAESTLALAGVDVCRHDLAASPHSPMRCDGVVCVGVLEYLPDEDVPWVIGELFANASRFVCVAVDNVAGEERREDGVQLARHVRDASWWMEHFENAARHCPDRRWTLVRADSSRGRRPEIQVREGGNHWGESPRVWALCDGQRENADQALALAEALGWPYECKQLRFEGSKESLSKTSERLEAPWPDVVISAGRACANRAAWIRDQDLGRTRLVHVGCSGGEVADRFDAVVTPSYARHWPHPNRVETVAPLTLTGAKRLTRSSKTPLHLFDESPEPHVLLLVDTAHPEDMETRSLEQMAFDVRDLAEHAGGSARAVVSSRLGKRARESLGRGLGDERKVHKVDSTSGGNELSAILASANAVVVAGNGAQWVAEAASSARCVYIYPIEERGFSLRRAILQWVEEIANRRPTNRRGTARPQQRLEYICARLIERGIAIPPRDPNQLHQALYRRGAARPFAAVVDLTMPTGGEPLREAEEVSHRVRHLLGYPPAT